MGMLAGGLYRLWPPISAFLAHESMDCDQGMSSGKVHRGQSTARSAELYAIRFVESAAIEIWVSGGI